MIIVITRPDFFEGEAEKIAQLLQSGRADLVHIRKPRASQSEVEQLLFSIPTELYSRLVLHDHHSLAIKYGLRGVHLNSRNPEPPAGWNHGCKAFVPAGTSAFLYPSAGPGLPLLPLPGP